MSTFNLPLPGWEQHSVWGWDPGQNCLYAQLWRNGNDPAETDDGPDVWLTPPTFDTLDVEDLGEAIAAETGQSMREVRGALGNRPYAELFVSG